MPMKCMAQMPPPMLMAPAAVQAQRTPRVLAAAIRLGERLGVPESTLLAALAHGSATSRVVDIVAERGSVTSFIEVAGAFVGKDVAVVRSIAEDLGSDLGALDDVIKAIDVARKV